MAEKWGDDFLSRVFTRKEIKNAKLKTGYYQHLAGRFAAKEAVRKVYGDKPMMLTDIEVRHRPSGKPEIWIKGRRSRSFLISISHNATVAIAIALKQS